MPPVTEEVRLQALAGLRILDTVREERFDRSVRLARSMFDVPAARVTLIDEDRQWNKAEVGFGSTELPRSQSFCDHTVRDRSPMVVSDATADERFRDNPLVTARDGLRFYAGQPVTTPAGVAVGALCITDTRPREMTGQQLDMLRDLAALVELELARTDELDRAGDVQRRLLPRSAPALPGYDVAGACVPASAVGGDFYDWYPVDDDFQVVLADVMGKGMPAALIAAGVRALMRGASRFDDLETAVNRVAYAMEQDLSETSTFVTMFAARLDPVRHTLAYVDAGHGIAAVVSAEGKVRSLQSVGLPLGVPAIEPWTAGTLVLEPGDTFLCLSDGVLDSFTSMEQAVRSARRTAMRCDTAQEVVDAVLGRSLDDQATDDVTVVVMRRASA